MRSFTVTPADTEVDYVLGVYHAEDLTHLPRTDWLVTSGMAGPDVEGRHNQGHLYAVDTNALTAHEIYPAGAEHRLDALSYGDVEPPDPQNFSAVGVSLREGAGDVHSLYVVNGGSRQSIEVFEIDASGGAPTATWVGAILNPPGVHGNAVAPLPDGGLVATNFMRSDDAHAQEKIIAGEVTGNLMEWHPESGWAFLPGTECCSPNGVEVSADGRWYVINAWAARRIVRVSRGPGELRRDELELSVMPDNFKRMPDGRMLLVGQDLDPPAVFRGCGYGAYGASAKAGATFDVGFTVLSLDPETLTVQELLRFDEPGGFGTGATAVEVGGALWVGSARSDRIARFRRKTPFIESAGEGAQSVSADNGDAGDAEPKLEGEQAMSADLHALSVEDYNEISQLYGYYARDVDPGSVRDASWMFTDDGVFHNPGDGICVQGRQALHEFYEGIRAKHGNGVRHFNTTYVIVGTAEGARSSGYALTVERLSQDGAPMLSGFGKYEDRLVKTSEGWRFKERIWAFDTHRGDPAPVSASPTGLG